jgi:pyruvate/oxaloacetate carboxyltransferase
VAAGRGVFVGVGGGAVGVALCTVAVAPAAAVSTTEVGIASGVETVAPGVTACGFGIGPLDWGRVQPATQTMMTAIAKSNAAPR